MADQTTSNAPETAKAEMQAVLAANRKWFTTLGIVLIVLGAIAIIFPFVTGIAVTIFIGWLFLVGGIMQIVHSFSVKSWGGFALSLLVGALYVLTGGWMAFFPLAGIVTLTILLSAMFLVQGALEVAMAFRIRTQKGWWWMLLSGIIAVLAGALIFSELPSSAAWAIGLLTGINLMSSGFAFYFLSRDAGTAEG